MPLSFSPFQCTEVFTPSVLLQIFANGAKSLTTVCLILIIDIGCNSIISSIKRLSSARIMRYCFHHAAIMAPEPIFHSLDFPVGQPDHKGIPASCVSTHNPLCIQIVFVKMSCAANLSTTFFRFFLDTLAPINVRCACTVVNLSSEYTCSISKKIFPSISPNARHFSAAGPSVPFIFFGQTNHDFLRAQLYQFFRNRLCIRFYIPLQ